MAWLLACATLGGGALPAAPPHDQTLSINGENASFTLSFDIPPQPLMSAIRAYSEVTGRSALVDASLVAGMHSPGVVGQYEPEDALQRLLAGTGLVASYAADHAFTLKLMDHLDVARDVPNEVNSTVTDDSTDMVTEHYAGSMQRSIEVALCRSDLAQPGTFRLALQIWIDRLGRVTHARMLSDENGVQARVVSDIVGRLKLAPPPPDMPQPVTLLLLPRPDSGAYDCATTARHSY